MEKEIKESKALAQPIEETAIIQNPAEEVTQAQKCAKALQGIVAQKPKKVIIGGEQYLEFEDWQTLGRFFHYTCKTDEAVPTEIEGIKGAKAKSHIYCNGEEIGGAEAYCMRDEDNWKSKPWFQLASMAQTRAGAKGFRNLLAWVVVLAGYKTTPAEEMTYDTIPPSNSAYKTLLGDFQKAKAKLGAGDYYRILGEFGYEKSNEITNVSEGRKILNEMRICWEQRNGKK